MDKYRTLLFIFPLFFCHALVSFSGANEVAKAGADVGKWTMDYDAAAKLAKEKDLPMLLNFTGSDWCHYCIEMDKNVFAKEAWKTFAEKEVVLVMLDFPRDKSKIPEDVQKRNSQLQVMYGVRGYPTYIVLDSDGKSVLAKLGAIPDGTPEKFIEQFKNGTKFSSARRAAYKKANPDKAEAFQAAYDGIKKIEDEFKKWIETKPEQNKENEAKVKVFQERFDEAVKKLNGFE